MTNLRKSTVVALAGLGALALLGTPAIAAGNHGTATAQTSVQPVQMGQAQDSGWGMMAPGRGYGPGYGYGMGPGTMGPGQGYGPGPGMGYGMGMMGPGTGYGPGMGYGMGPGMMGPGTGYGPCRGYGMGPGMMAPGQGYGPGSGFGMAPAARPDKDLSSDDVRARLEQSLKWHGNERLKVGGVEETDDDTIVAEIVTQDGSLVQRFEINRHNGQMRRAE